jgi:hypothetical protein
MLTCKVFVNPTTETKANRDGIVHVISRMKWYYELSILLLKENTADIETSAGGQYENPVGNVFPELVIPTLMRSGRRKAFVLKVPSMIVMKPATKRWAKYICFGWMKKICTSF